MTKIGWQIVLLVVASISTGDAEENRENFLTEFSNPFPLLHGFTTIHHNRHHADLNTIAPPRCEICGESCISVPELEAHIRWKHSEKDISFENVPCNVCENENESYNTLREYLIHSLTDEHGKLTEEKKRKWREGDESEDDFEGVDEHKVKVCLYPNCGRKFVSQEKLRRHRERKCHAGIGTKSGFVICEDCGKSFDSSWRLKQHKSEVHSKLQHECFECGKKFQTRSNLKTHVSYAHAERSIPCEICGRMFATISIVKVHMRNHNKRHKCHLCPAAFGGSSNLDVHLMKHAGIRLGCEWCTLSFADSSSLVKHCKKFHPDKYKEHIDANPCGGYRGWKRVTVEEYVAAGGTIKNTTANKVEYLDSYGSNNR